MRLDKENEPTSLGGLKALYPTGLRALHPTGLRALHPTGLRALHPTGLRALHLGVLIGLLLSCSTMSDPGSSETPATAGDALAYYEQIRAELARDEGTQVPANAMLLARAAEQAAAGSSDTRAELEELASAAEKLGALPSSDMRSLRIGFGELSRAAVTLIVADESLAEGRHIFRCPMAKGYKKWVQTTDELENPYMGSRMLHCGSKTGWAP